MDITEPLRREGKIAADRARDNGQFATASLLTRLTNALTEAEATIASLRAGGSVAPETPDIIAPPRDIPGFEGTTAALDNLGIHPAADRFRAVLRSGRGPLPTDVPEGAVAYTTADDGWTVVHGGELATAIAHVRDVASRFPFSTPDLLTRYVDAVEKHGDALPLMLDILAGLETEKEYRVTDGVRTRERDKVPRPQTIARGWWLEQRTIIRGAWAKVLG